MTTTQASLDERLDAARAAGRVLARMSPGAKVQVLEAVAQALVARSEAIIAMNAEDLADARKSNAPAAMVDRLMLDQARIEGMAEAIRAVAALPDPVGTITGGWRVPNGLEIVETRVPLGVIGVIYEGRPNVTTDAAALALKSGNAIVLRGSRIAARSNEVLGEVVASAIAGAGVPPAAVTMLGTDRDEMLRLIQAEGKVDLVIPRGRRGPQGLPAAERPRAGHLRGVGQLPRVRGCRRRPRRRPGHRRERQGAAPGRVQRLRDPARSP